MAPVGIWTAHRLPETLLDLGFTAMLSAIAARMWLGARMPPATPDATGPTVPCTIDPAAAGRLVWNRSCARALLAAGFGTGFLSGLFGVGGGFLTVPALKKVTDLSMASIIATSLAVIALVSLTGVGAAVIAGRMTWNVALPFAGGAVVGAWAGRTIRSRLSGAALQRGFAVTVFLIAMAMAVRVLAGGR